MLTYATPEQLASWTGVAPPPGAANLLRSASILVHRAVLTAVYDIEDGLPTLPALRDALANATCSQVGTWIALAIDPAKVGTDGKSVSAKSIGSASVQYAVYAATAQTLADAATSLSQEALLILAGAGLAGSPAMFG